MNIGFVSSPERGETDRLLAEAAEQLLREGVQLAGIIKHMDHVARAENGCDMQVRVLPAGPIIQITQNLGQGSNACRLDPGALVEAVTRVEAGDLQEASLFILNKFGPEEATGRGFVSAIGRAIESDIPVLVGVGKASLDAFGEFSGGLAHALPADLDNILDWCRTAVATQPDQRKRA